MKDYKILFLVLLVLLVIIALLFVKDTYSRYLSSAEINEAIPVAKWDFESDNTPTTIDVSLSETYDPLTLTNGKIAPGTSGSFSVELNNSNSETGIDFSVLIGTISNIPANLKFYKDSNFTQEIVPGTGTITGQIEALDNTSISVYIYWKWEYYISNSTDTLDTADGIRANNLTIPVIISGQQVIPVTTIVTTHINN